MTRKELIQLIQYTCGEIVISCTITEEDAESILDDFTNETSLEEDLQPFYPEMTAPYDTRTSKKPTIIDAVKTVKTEPTNKNKPSVIGVKELEEEAFSELYIKELEDKGYICKITPPQDRPERYASRELNGMDVIDLVQYWNLSFAEGNILKYLLRDKGEDIQDLEKIKVYADRRIKQLNK